MPRNREQHHEPLEHNESSVEELLAEYERLDADWKELNELWGAAKQLLTEPLTDDLRGRLQELEQELADLHGRQHTVLDRQAEIERRVLRADAHRDL